MNDFILNDLLKQYEQKRLNNIRDAEIRKENLYIKYPKLRDLDYKINYISINTAKNILIDNSKDSLNTLKIEIENLKEEKKQLLESLNLPENYLLPKYDCNICKDTGYIFKNGQSVMCSCLKQQIYDKEYNQKNINNINTQTFDNFNINLYSNIVDEKKYNTNISPRENILIIKKDSENFINNFDNEQTKNLIFSGGTGLGKTFLSNCIINKLLEKGKTVMYQTAPIMFDNLINSLFVKSNNKTELSKNLLSVDLLVIDDLGTESMNSMKFTELYKIINTRLLSQNGKSLKTIISTNLDLNGLFNTYDERLVSRFIGYYNIYRFYGDDIRVKNSF